MDEGFVAGTLGESAFSRTSPQSGEDVDRFRRFFLGDAQLVKALQVEPELRAHAEEVPKTQGSVSRNCTLAVQDAGNAVGRHIQFARQLSGAHAEFIQFFSELLPWMYRVHCQIRISFIYALRQA
jgi:hypothetical protein